MLIGIYCLTFFGGPNHVYNNCNSPVMANFSGKDYKKNASYYYIGHFSKFIKRNARRIAFSKFTSNLEVTTFQNFDEAIVVVIMNRTEKTEKFTMVINNKCYSDNIEKHSIITYVI